MVQAQRVCTRPPPGPGGAGKNMNQYNVRFNSTFLAF